MTEKRQEGFKLADQFFFVGFECNVDIAVEIPETPGPKKQVVGMKRPHLHGMRRKCLVKGAASRIDQHGPCFRKQA